MTEPRAAGGSSELPVGLSERADCLLMVFTTTIFEVAAKNSKSAGYLRYRLELDSGKLFA